MNNAINPQSHDRLLKSAVQLFAEKGFQGATVREICNLADTNAASVNYYFRNKEQLYQQTLSYAVQYVVQQYPMTAAKNPALAADQRLREFVRVFLQRVLDKDSLEHHGKLIAQEIANPTSALDNLIQDFIKPNMALLYEIVQQLTPPGLPEPVLQRCLLSIVGQCLMFKHSRSIIDRLNPALIADAAQIEASAAHIAEFSLAAIRQLASEYAG